jgi:hypothetical protein
VRVHGLRSSTRSTRGYIPRPHPGPKKISEKRNFKKRQRGLLGGPSIQRQVWCINDDSVSGIAR